ncbi:hypothetical protein ES703_65468 [subsurface metagenome]
MIIGSGSNISELYNQSFFILLAVMEYTSHNAMGM